jgi:hypothetical protein
MYKICHVEGMDEKRSTKEIYGDAAIKGRERFLVKLNKFKRKARLKVPEISEHV